jgi:hypothetical protein
MLLRVLGFSEMRVLRFAAHVAKAREEKTGNGDSPITLTNRPRGDGGGSQILYSAFALAVARGLGLAYEHRIFETVEHTVGDANSFRERWNRLVDFESAVPLSPQKRTYSMGSRVHTLRALLSVRRRFSVTSSRFRYLINENPEWLHSIRPQLRKIYVRQANHAPAKSDSAVTFHIRRGDVTMTHNPGMYTSADQLLADISRIRSVPAYRELWAEIVIEENDPELEMKLPRKCRLIVIAEPFDAFDRLVEAKILVIDKSSFSYVAGLLSQNTVIYRDYWYPPMPDWLQLAYLTGPEL